MYTVLQLTSSFYPKPALVGWRSNSTWLADSVASHALRNQAGDEVIAGSTQYNLLVA
jgi:hypothetical protein